MKCPSCDYETPPIHKIVKQKLQRLWWRAKWACYSEDTKKRKRELNGAMEYVLHRNIMEELSKFEIYEVYNYSSKERKNQAARK